MRPAAGSTIMLLMALGELLRELWFGLVWCVFGVGFRVFFGATQGCSG